MNILNHIYNEFVDHARRPKDAKSEYNALFKDYSDTVDSFFPTLSPNQIQTAFTLEHQRNLLAAMDEEFMFCYGFSLGAKLILEILHSSNQ